MTSDEVKIFFLSCPFDFFVSLQSNNSKEIVMNDTILLTDKRVFYNQS